MELPTRHSQSVHVELGLRLVVRERMSRKMAVVLAVACGPALPSSDRAAESSESQPQQYQGIGALHSDTKPDAPLEPWVPEPATSESNAWWSNETRLAPPDPRVQDGPPQVSGRIPSPVVAQVLRANVGRLRHCFEPGALKDPSLAGSMVVTFEISTQGKVVALTYTSELRDSAVGACVAKAISELSFPQPDGGNVKITYPIRFSPGPAAAASSSSP